MVYAASLLQRMNEETLAKNLQRNRDAKPGTDAMIKYEVHVEKDGSKFWHINDKRKLKLHREDGPAIEYADGSKEWHLNGKRHRVDGPAVEWADGRKEWHLNGKRHREDGPAVEYADGSKVWRVNDKLHREDGPAIKWADGSKQWFLNGQELTKQAHGAETLAKNLQRNRAGISTTGKPLLPKNKQRNLKDMIKRSKQLGPVGKLPEEAELTYEDYAMAILTLGGYDSFGDIDKEDMQDVMEAIDHAYNANDVEVFIKAFSQNNQEE
jgi:hypothetical protein